ncbi:PulJ/GspJ family protein [Glaciibacter psychrotolerans]|uniref:Prepilin-type N-terminal cleavage/methylation domain-containing protein n=1 Tax=Glaciibacter psychrotolerans TaxID=670054 RepID=A0A7Z0EH94_9MICO|nr:type II secretion system protein [Leifsonia psychrotolerans]NYJ21525.1 prepilin-type N-terminal cleavage/methylation domain-containing protein [Leifsonia psychrotolerans]
MVKARGSSEKAPDSVSEFERGMTLIEMVVSMTIFLIFIALVLSTTVTLAQSTTRTQLTAEASNQALSVFGAFDRQVRYADVILPPTKGASGAYYVSYRTPPGLTSGGGATCTQWRYSPTSALLESRTWTEKRTGAMPPYSLKMSQVIPRAGGKSPFELTPIAEGGPTMQSLTVTLKAGNDDLKAGAEMSTTFVARNSSSDAPDLDSACSAGEIK